MIRLPARIAATLFALSLMPAPVLTAPALAAPTGWSATLRAPLPKPRQEIVNSVLWKCAGDQCLAPAQGSRPLFVCQKLVRKMGPIGRFTSPEGELSADDLAKCNG